MFGKKIMQLIRNSKFFQSESVNCKCVNVRTVNDSCKKFTDSVLPVERTIDSPNHYLKSKFNDLVIWYEQLTGMDEVRIMQNRVLEAQDKFVSAQEKRRESSKALAEIQTKLKDIYAELDTTTRGEERYLQLITQEHSVLKEERKVQADFSLTEREERESFTLLSNCVKESHEKERAQAERTKYWSIIGSVIGTIIGILGTSINNEFKMRELRRLVKETSLRTSPDPSTSSLLTRHEHELSSLILDLRNTIYKESDYQDSTLEHGVLGRLDQLLHTVNKQHEEPNISTTVQKVDKSLQDLKTMLSKAKHVDGHLVAIPTDLESLIETQRYETRLILVGATFVGILIPVIATYIQRLI